MSESYMNATGAARRIGVSLVAVQGVFAVLLLVVLVCLGVASAEETKGIKAKKITWKKDGAKVVLMIRR